MTIDRLKQKLGRIYGRTVTVALDALLGAVAQQFERLGIDIPNAIAQLRIPSSSEDWAELWGTVFGVDRLPGELDERYTARIIDETIRQRPQNLALVEIVANTLGVHIVIRDLWPMVLLTDQFMTPAGRPLQVLDSHLVAGWVPGSVEDDAVRLAFGYPYLECAFGVWIDVDPGDPFDYTLENVLTLMPHILLTDQFTPGSPHVLDGHLISPDLGGPTDTAKYLFSVTPEPANATVAEVMALINRHRAAGTEAVFMGFVMN